MLQALPQLSHSLALRSLIDGVMVGGSALESSTFATIIGAWLLLLQEKEASLLRSLETANLAALQATRQALPQLPHPLALRSLLNGVMSGASAVRENLYDNVRSRGQRQQASEVSLRYILSRSIWLNTRRLCHLTEHVRQKVHL